MARERTDNLSALADRLMQKKQHKDLAGKIRQTVRYNSLLTDLKMAIEACEALSDLLEQPNAGNWRQAIVSYSLMTTAISLYSRATKTSSGPRPPSQLLHLFNDTERSAHQEICDLRDEAIAHYGSGGSYEGDWKREIAVVHTRLIGTATESKIGVVTRRITLDKALVNRVRSQVERAQELLLPISRKHVENVGLAIDAIIKLEPEFYEQLACHPLNLEVFLGSAEAAAEARAAFDTGQAGGIVRE